MADFQVLWTETARLDLTGIVEFIAEERGSATALEVLDRVERRCRTLATLPERGRIVPELRLVGVHTCRELIEAVIGLAPNVFYGTGLAPAIRPASAAIDATICWTQA